MRQIASDDLEGRRIRRARPRLNREGESVLVTIADKGQKQACFQEYYIKKSHSRNLHPKNVNVKLGARPP